MAAKSSWPAVLARGPSLRSSCRPKSRRNNSPKEPNMIGSILVVDDERGQREILNTILQKEGYRIVDVPGGREAQEQLEIDEFDLILTDLKMQGMSGMELMEKILAEN